MLQCLCACQGSLVIQSARCWLSAGHPRGPQGSSRKFQRKYTKNTTMEGKSESQHHLRHKMTKESSEEAPKDSVDKRDVSNASEMTSLQKYVRLITFVLVASLKRPATLLSSTKYSSYTRDAPIQFINRVQNSLSLTFPSRQVVFNVAMNYI